MILKMLFRRRVVLLLLVLMPVVFLSVVQFTASAKDDSIPARIIG